MLLIHSEWSDFPSFRMIPATSDCPYVECMFETAKKLLIVVGKEKKETFHFLPRLDEDGAAGPIDKKIKRMVSDPATPGQPLLDKNNKPVFEMADKTSVSGKLYREQRVSFETYQEYLILNKRDILDFINHFAINAKSFEVEPYFEIKVSEGLDQQFKPELLKATNNETTTPGGIILTGSQD